MSIDLLGYNIRLRIQEIKDKEQGFSKKTMRWQNVEITANGKSKHISVADFHLCTAEELVLAFEIIIRQYYKSM